MQGPPESSHFLIILLSLFTSIPWDLKCSCVLFGPAVSSGQWLLVLRKCVRVWALFPWVPSYQSQSFCIQIWLLLVILLTFSWIQPQLPQCHRFHQYDNLLSHNLWPLKSSEDFASFLIIFPPCILTTDLPNLWGCPICATDTSPQQSSLTPYLPRCRRVFSFLMSLSWPLARSQEESRQHYHRLTL